MVQVHLSLSLFLSLSLSRTHTHTHTHPLPRTHSLLHTHTLTHTHDAAGLGHVVIMWTACFDWMGEAGSGIRGGEKFSKVSTLLDSLCMITVQLTFLRIFDRSRRKMRVAVQWCLRATRLGML